MTSGEADSEASGQFGFCSGSLVSIGSIGVKGSSDGRKAVPVRKEVGAIGQAAPTQQAIITTIPPWSV